MFCAHGMESIDLWRTFNVLWLNCGRDLLTAIVHRKSLSVVVPTNGPCVLSTVYKTFRFVYYFFYIFTSHICLNIACTSILYIYAYSTAVWYSTTYSHDSSHISLHTLYTWQPICTHRIFHSGRWWLNRRPYIILWLILKIILQELCWACYCNITHYMQLHFYTHTHIKLHDPWLSHLI